MLYIVTGHKNSGKSTFAQKWVEKWRSANSTVTGILTEAIYRYDRKAGYQVIDLHTGRKKILALDSSILAPMQNGESIGEQREKQIDAQKEHRLGEKAGERVGRFFISREGLDFAKQAIQTKKAADLLVIDEISFLEISFKGHAEALKWALANFHGNLLLVVRLEVLQDFLVFQEIGLRKKHVITVTQENRQYIIPPNP